MEQANLY